MLWWLVTAAAVLWSRHRGMNTEMAVTLYCGACGKPLTVSGAIPGVCPECHLETKWIVVPFALTENDTRFLRSLRIKAE